MLHSTAVKASTSSVNSQNTKYHQDIFHIFTQNMQTDGGRDKTPITHSLKSNDQIINITCLPITGVCHSCAEKSIPLQASIQPSPMVVSVASVRQIPKDHSIVLPVHCITVLYCLSNRSNVFPLAQAHTPYIPPVDDLPSFLSWWK